MTRVCLCVVCCLSLAGAGSTLAQTKPKVPPKPAPKAAPAKPVQPAPAAQAPAPPPSPIADLLKSRQLEQSYNPVLLEYLLEEGREKLPPAQHKAALDQIVTRFKAELDIKPSAQVTASLATALGALTPGVVGEGVATGAGSVWATWVDAANLLVKAGYADAAAPFLENCVRTNPYPDLRSRCTVGLAAANPAGAMALLTSLLDRKNPEEVINTSLRLMGVLAGAEGCPAEQKEAAVKELLARTQGMMNSLYYEAAIEGLEQTGDPRAVEAIRKLTGSTKGTEVSRAAKRALALTFKDPAAIEGLRKDAKGGMMKTDDDRFFGGMVLIKAKDAAGYAYAQDQLAKKKGGFFSSNKGADYRPALVDLLVEYGGPQGVAPLQAGLAAQKPDEWLRAYTAIGLLELGDKTGLDDVKRALANTHWTHTRVRAAEALATQGDVSGVPVLQAMAKDPSLLKKAADVVSGKDVDDEAMRIAIARALGRMNVPDGVPVLAALVADTSAEVRVAAAYALGEMTDASALDAYPAALAQDYGKDVDRLRSPDIAAHLLRTAVGRFPQDDRTKALLRTAATSDVVTVRFLALVAGRP